MTPEAEKYIDWLMGQDPCIVHAIDMGDGTVAYVKRLLFHWTLLHADIGDYDGYKDRWCYATRELAEDALTKWFLSSNRENGPEGWHRHPNTGRRRPNGDATREYIAW